MAQVSRATCSSTSSRACTSSWDALGPTRVFATGGLRFWKDGRDVPDIMLGLCDYPQTASHPAFNLALRVNFVNGSGETYGFRFVGSEGVLSIGNGVTVSKQPRESEPGYTIDTFPKAVQEQFLKEYREKYPAQRASADAIRPQAEERYNAAARLQRSPRTSPRLYRMRCARASRSSKTRRSDCAPPGRPCFPCTSYFEQRAIGWDPQSMTVKG